MVLLFKGKGKVLYKAAKNVRVCTFANHKGGVGKSTIAFFTIKEILSRFPEKKVLVIDLSTSGDITKYIFGPKEDGSRQSGSEAVNAGCTIDEFAEKSKNPKKFYQFWRKNVNTYSCIFKVDQACKSAPPNLYLMTNGKQHRLSIDDRVPELDDAAISRVCDQIRKDLSKDKSDWIVICDTDGGETHDFTRFGIAFANSIIVPMSAFMGAENDADRLELLFQYAERLKRQGLTDATVDCCVFNNMRSFRDAECIVSPGKLVSNFTPDADTRKVLSSVVDKFDRKGGWVDRFPELLKPLRGQNCFSTIRHGGKEFNAASFAPWRLDAGNAQTEIELLVDKVIGSAHNGDDEETKENAENDTTARKIEY